MTRDDSILTLRIEWENSTREHLVRSSWRPSRLLEYVSCFENILLGQNPDLESEVDDNAFVSLNAIRDNCISIDLASSDLAQKTNEEVAIEIAAGGAGLAYEANTAAQKMRKLATRDEVTIACEGPSAASTWQVTKSTKIQPSRQTMNCRTSLTGVIVQIHLANGTAKLKYRNKQVQLTDLTPPVLMAITQAWGTHEGGPLATRFRATGLAKYSNTSERYVSMAVDKIKQVERPTPAMLERLQTLIGPISPHALEELNGSEGT